ncbi:LAFA_0G00408g1_1 [Lachancea sp. 'fantastica']|nr:LAFA_0G00408g1_1 [Lachancea sp. 'fantastica']
MSGGDAEHNALSQIFRISKLFDTVDSSDSSRSYRDVEGGIISGLEFLAGLFDDLHLLKSFGIIGEQNKIYQRFKKTGLCSKVWLVSLILSSRKSLGEIIRLAASRSKLRTEKLKFMRSPANSVRKILIDKISNKLDEIDRKLRLAVIELLQTFAYLLVVIIDVFKLGISEKWRKLIDRVSGFFTILKFLFLAASPS